MCVPGASRRFESANNIALREKISKRLSEQAILASAVARRRRAEVSASYKMDAVTEDTALRAANHLLDAVKSAAR